MNERVCCGACKLNDAHLKSRKDYFLTCSDKSSSAYVTSLIITVQASVQDVFIKTV